MAQGDEDEVVGHEGEDQNSGTAGGGAEGTDGPGDADETEDATEHPDAAEDDGQSEEVDAAPERPPSRAERRFQTLANETKAAKAEAEAARREAAELRREQLSRQQHLTEQQEQERLALMTPAERAEYRVVQAEQRTNARIAQSEFRTQDLVDKASYDAKATLNPVYDRFKDEVEDRLSQMRSQGQTVPRENILKFLLGERALNGAAKGGKKAVAAAAKRVDAAKVKPTNAKGDSASQRGKQPSTAEARLKDVFI